MAYRVWLGLNVRAAPRKKQKGGWHVNNQPPEGPTQLDSHGLNLSVGEKERVEALWRREHARAVMVHSGHICDGHMIPWIISIHEHLKDMGPGVTMRPLPHGAAVRIHVSVVVVVRRAGEKFHLASWQMGSGPVGAAGSSIAIKAVQSVLP